MALERHDNFSRFEHNVRFLAVLAELVHYVLWVLVYTKQQSRSRPIVILASVNLPGMILGMKLDCTTQKTICQSPQGSSVSTKYFLFVCLLFIVFIQEIHIHKSTNTSQFKLCSLICLQ